MLQFHSNGKLLLTGEYYVLEGAKALAIPTKFGQSLEVSHSIIEVGEMPILKWESYDVKNEIWLNATFDIDNFKIISPKQEGIERLQDILQQARKQNPHFLQEKQQQTHVKTQLQFQRNWGLGSSSTLISNIAQWAEIDAFELLENTFGGSGYDIACAQSDQAILYQKKPTLQSSKIDFHPPFYEQLYFVHLNKKQNSRDAIRHFYEQDAATRQNIILILNEITERILKVETLAAFETLLQTHEQIIADNLLLSKVKDLYFADYWGVVKSLGAWGGDFVLVTSDLPQQETFTYFAEKGFETVLKWNEMVLTRTAR
ncbi:MAG: GYDIA family GHMP kinase [Chitinophagales bacterium]